MSDNPARDSIFKAIEARDRLIVKLASLDPSLTTFPMDAAKYARGIADLEEALKTLNQSANLETMRNRL